MKITKNIFVAIVLILILPFFIAKAEEIDISSDEDTSQAEAQTNVNIPPPSTVTTIAEEKPSVILCSPSKTTTNSTKKFETPATAVQEEPKQYTSKSAPKAEAPPPAPEPTEPEPLETEVSQYVLPEVDDSEIDLPYSLDPTDNIISKNTPTRLVPWIIISLGLVVVLGLLFFGGRKAASKDVKGKKRYISNHKQRPKKRLLHDKYYRNIKKY